MAKKKTLLLRNTSCDFTCPWANKLDGSDNHSFVKDEIFEVPAEVERVRNGKKVMVSALELLQYAFGRGIEEAKGAVSMSGLKEKDEEIERLKAELAKMKTKGSKKKNESQPEPDVPENTEESDNNEESEIQEDTEKSEE